MRPFFMTVGILAWVWAFAVMWIFAESGGALTIIAAGVFAGVAIVSLGCERILKVLEEIQQQLPRRRVVVEPAPQRKPMPAASVPTTDPAATLL